MAVKIYFSDFFEVSPEIIENYGAFNVSLVNDLPLFIDPFLLFNSDKSEYQNLHQQIIDYVRFLKNASLFGSIKPGLLKSWFFFPEVKQTWLGYSLVGNQGRGLGGDFAESLNRNLHSIFANFGDEDVTRGSHLEKLCLIEDGVGRDNISDFTTNLIKEYLLNYTQSFALQYINSELLKKVAVNKVRFKYQTQTWGSSSFTLPYYGDDYVLLSPKDLLTKDDTWISNTDLANRFQDIAATVPNIQLRDQISNYFLNILPANPKKKDFQEAVFRTVNKYPAVLDHYIKHKEDTGNEAIIVSQEKVQETEDLFVIQANRLVDNLSFNSNFYGNSGSTYGEAYDRVIFLKDVIENKGGYEIFYIKGQAVKREHDVQILFKLVWFGTASDVNSEVNNGRGPVDFKISRGRADMTLVEFKLASNSQLKRNLQNQVSIYEQANNTRNSIKVIMYFSENELFKVKTILKDLGLSNDKSIILIDARWDNKISASKA